MLSFTLEFWDRSFGPYSRFYRVLRNVSSLLARLAQELSDSQAKLFVVDLKLTLLARGPRIRTHAMLEAAVDRVPRTVLRIRPGSSDG